jgi:formylglycine-generating enzyme required for sulfatase activity
MIVAPYETDQTPAFRVIRGGSWGGTAWWCRAAYRFGSPPADRFDYVGVRLVRP